MNTSRGLSPLSIAGLSLAALGLGLAFTEIPGLALWAGLGGMILAEKGVGKAGSEARAWAVIMAGTLLATAVTQSLNPWLGLGFVLVVWGHLFRSARVTYFGTTGWWWLDAGLALPGLGLMVYGALLAHAWPAWVLVAYAGFHCFNVMMGTIISIKTLTHHRGGYGVEPGHPAPDFNLADQDGFPVSLGNFKGRNHVLLIFVRGDWCPSCHITLRTYARSKERFQEQGVTLLAVGPDPVGVNLRMVQELGVPYKMLSDEGQRTAMAYGVQIGDDFTKSVMAEGIPLPASFLVDKGGTVRYTSRPERAGEFLDPKTIFPVLQALGA
jgi:peroxiredoxin